MYKPFETFEIKGRCISVIGSGGKTTFLRYLACRLQGTVILTTSTHILPFREFPLITVHSETLPESRKKILQEVRSALSVSRVICLGQSLTSGKLTSPVPSVSFEDLLSAADYVAIEADGSAGRPLKAHRPFEPVIPACSDMTVCLIGASGIGKPVSEVCHCPELFSAISGIKTDQPADETSIAAVINREDLADWYLINQSDILKTPERALHLCRLIRKNASFCSLNPPVPDALP